MTCTFGGHNNPRWGARCSSRSAGFNKNFFTQLSLKGWPNSIAPHIPPGRVIYARVRSYSTEGQRHRRIHTTVFFAAKERRHGTNRVSLMPPWAGTLSPVCRIGQGQVTMVQKVHGACALYATLQAWAQAIILPFLSFKSNSF